jgi:hypothetical protein
LGRVCCSGSRDGDGVGVIDFDLMAYLQRSFTVITDFWVYSLYSFKKYLLSTVLDAGDRIVTKVPALVGLT